MYSITPMSVDGTNGYAVTRTVNGTVKYMRWRGIACVAIMPLATADLVVAELTVGRAIPEQRWVERDGARLDTKKPISRRPALYCPEGRHLSRYPKGGQVSVRC